MVLRLVWFNRLGPLSEVSDLFKTLVLAPIDDRVRGWVVLWSVQSEDTWALTMEDPLYPLTIVVMFLLGLTGVTVLPWLKTASDAEAQQEPGTDPDPSLIASGRPTAGAWHRSSPHVC